MNLEEMIKGNPQALVTSYNGVLVADSLEVADRFGKAHKNVIRDIENLINTLESGSSILSHEKFFIPTSYPSRGKSYKKYLLTRDGFSLLVMGFTGPAALHWKLLYIDAFNKMEAQLRSNPQNLTEIVTQITTQVVKSLLPEIKEAVAPPPEPPKPKHIYAVVAMEGVKKTTVRYNGYDPTAAKNIAWNLKQEGVKHIILKGDL